MSQPVQNRECGVLPEASERVREEFGEQHAFEVGIRSCGDDALDDVSVRLKARPNCSPKIALTRQPLGLGDQPVLNEQVAVGRLVLIELIQ